MSIVEVRERRKRDNAQNEQPIFEIPFPGSPSSPLLVGRGGSDFSVQRNLPNPSEVDTYLQKRARDQRVDGQVSVERLSRVPEKVIDVANLGQVYVLSGDSL